MLRFVLRRVAWGVLASLCSAVLGCDGAPGSSEPELAFRVEWLGREPSASLPTTVAAIRFYVLREGERFDPANFADRSLGSLDDADDDGHPELSIPDLPTYRPVSFLLYGLDRADAPTYIGHAGPMTLAAGERRYVDIKMYPVGMSEPLTGLPGRVLSTATALPDGRVLVAGGFTDVRAGTCPGDVPAESRCFDMRATRDAYVLDPGTATFHAVRGGGMLEARGGQTATALADGRVLVAGGASQALLVMSPQGLPTVTGFAPLLRPIAPPTSLASFEIFEPDGNPETVDTLRDGDPGRGAFVGSAGAPTTPGRLNHGRLFHSAVGVPGRPDRVILAGGAGDALSPASWEIFDAQKPGGWGVYAETTNRLPVPRYAPSAVSLTMPSPGRVWIFGGRIATSDAELADVWRESGTDPNGSVQSASTAMGVAFPRGSAADTATYPQYSLVGTQVAPIAMGANALVVGWLGPRCAVGTDMIAYPPDEGGTGTEYCSNTADPSRRRSFSVSNETGITISFAVTQPHAFGSSVTLDDGSVAIVGGVSSIIFTAQPAIDIFTGRVDALGAPALSTIRGTLQSARLFHSSAALRDRGILTVGGLRFSTDARTATVVDTAEALYLPAP